MSTFRPRSVAPEVSRTLAVVAIIASIAAPAAAQEVPSSPAPASEAPASAAPESSAPPASEATSSEQPVARPRRRHRTTAAIHHRRRRRRVRRPRPRGPSVIIAARYTNIPTEGVSGPTWAVRFVGLPLSGRRDAGRYVRFSLGGELAFRSAPFNRTDSLIWTAFDLGFQYPFRNIVPFVAGTANFGIAERYRFIVPSVEVAYQLGIEAGASFRPDAFIGLEIAAGIGRTVIGEQWSLNGWIRFGLAFF